MSIQQIAALHCDDCNIRHPVIGLANATELRASAFGQGWRFPNRLSERGRTIKQVDDLCPKCHEVRDA